MRIVIVGSGFAGLNAAVKLRKKLKQSEDEVIVISDRPDFVFRPSLIWLPFHEHPVHKFTFPLHPTYEKIGVTFIVNHVQAIRPDRNHIICDDNEIIHYDYLIIASGASPDWSQVPGIEGNSSSIYNIPSALQTRKRLEDLEDGDPIVIGIADGNLNPGIAYEFIFECHAYLKKRQLNCPITFFTYEKELFDGKGMEPTEKIEELMTKKQIPYYCHVSIDQVDDGMIRLSNGKRLPYAFLLVLPPYKGRDFILSSSDVKHKNGILPVHDTLQSVEWDNVYVVGDTNDLYGTKTGRVAEVQGKLAADNIVNQINSKPLKPFEHDTLYLMEVGKEGAMFVIDKPSNKGTLKWTMSGVIPHMMKRAYEKYYVLRFS